MNDTPRTDAHMTRCACGSYVIETDFARGLEREVQAERDALTTLAKDTLKLRGEMDDLRVENAKLAALPDSEAWDDYNAIKTLQRENAALRADNAATHALVLELRVQEYTERTQAVSLEKENARLRAALTESEEFARKQGGESVTKYREAMRENAALRATIDSQSNYQRELRYDRDRLDWLMNHCASFPVTNKSATGVTNILPLRSSIDEAMGLMPSVSFSKEDK